MTVYITTERLLTGKRYRSFEPDATNYSLMMRMNSVLMNCVSSYFIWSRNQAILSFNENIFDGVVERVTVEENKLCFEIKSGILLKEVIAWN